MPKPPSPVEHTPEEFREIARQCRLLAQSAQDDNARRQLLMLAESWDILATERERFHGETSR